MTNPCDSSELHNILEKLSLCDEHVPELYEWIARWRRSCGDAERAETWQTWSLLPPNSAELRAELSQLWLDLDNTDKAAALLTDQGKQPGVDSWEKLNLLLRTNEIRQAKILQNRLFQNPPPLLIERLLDLQQLWRDANKPQQALELLQQMLVFMERRGESPSARFCSAVAELLEQLDNFKEAESWWIRTHMLQPHQAWPLMRLGRLAMRCKKPEPAFYYAYQALLRDPDHAFAPRLQYKALQALGAKNSLEILDGQKPQQTQNYSLEFLPPADLWHGCRIVALLGFDNAFILHGWRTILDEKQAVLYDELQPPLRLFLIASLDPLWVEYQANEIFMSMDDDVDIQLWPKWDPSQHISANLILKASPLQPGWHCLTPSEAG